MEEDFILPVTFNEKEMEFPARLRAYGYSFKIEVDINDMKVQFERDEERNWRALISYEEVQANKKLNGELLRAIAGTLDTVL